VPDTVAFEFAVHDNTPDGLPDPGVTVNVTCTDGAATVFPNPSTTATFGCEPHTAPPEPPPG
jgi:hypothetical protein